MNINIDVDIMDIVDEIVSRNRREDIVDLIRRIDLRVADYDFTKELRDYFIEQIKIEDEADR
jgi:hypothetical protein